MITNRCFPLTKVVMSTDTSNLDAQLFYRTTHSFVKHWNMKTIC